MIMRKSLQVVLIVALMAGMGACKHHRRSERALILQSNPVEAKATPQEYESQLRDLVTKQIANDTAASEERRTKILWQKPYFYREYSVYPETDTMKITIQETESRSAPVAADVSVSKQRFTTRFHRERAEAEKDANFIRGTGMEMMTYELRNSRWTRSGSIFVSEKTEENVNGEWVPVKESLKSTVPAEEEQATGWLKKAWSAISGK